MKRERSGAGQTTQFAELDSLGAIAGFYPKKSAPNFMGKTSLPKKQLFVL
jgi:hypothetical protein